MIAKQRAAEAALRHIRDGMTLGLGTGSTADLFLQALSAAIRSGRLRDVHGVPTSLRSEQRARELSIPLTTLAACPHPDLTVDGADEVAPNLDLIKGLGGALLREKIVAENSRRLIIIADVSKRVDRLGTRSPLPVEVAIFGHEVHVPFFRELGAEPSLRRTPEGTIFVTDNDNCIYDCHFAQGIAQPRAVLESLQRRAGIIDCGLFLGMAERALIADGQTVREITA